VIWVDQIIQGILLGGYYALLACGLSLMFGVMRIINLAHGDLAVLGAFLVWAVASQWGLPPPAAILVVVVIMGGVGWFLQRTMLERSLRSGMLVPLLATFGLGIGLENMLFEGFGPDTRSLAPEIGDLSFNGWQLTGSITIGELSTFIFIAAAVLLGGLDLFLRYTAFGRAIRATSEDPDTAELCGVDSRSVYALAAAIAIATAAVAGIALALRATFDPYAGPAQLIFAFEAVVIGGIGSLWGTLIGGIVLGIAQNVGAQFDPRWFLLSGHLVFLAVLVTRLVWSGIAARGGLRLRRIGIGGAGTRA
jgi:branched-chain amino acid transport system permease protein